MSTSLRKCICFTPDGTTTPSPGNQQNIAYQVGSTFPNLQFLVDGGTRWVKMWVSLRDLWPTKYAVNATIRDSLDY